jgi:hypothetical protein
MAGPKRARSLPEVDDALAGLARAVERHSRMIAAGRGDMATLTATVEQLAGSLRVAVDAWTTTTGLATTGQNGGEQDEVQTGSEGDSALGVEHSPDEAALPSWLVTTEWEVGESLTTQLAGWVRQVYLRWPDAALPACWSLHPWVMEELWVLHRCWWQARTGESASWLRWQDWHDRQRPATARRIAEGLAECGPEQHIPASSCPYPVVPGADVVPLSVTAWATEDHQAWPPQVPAHLLGESERKRPHGGGTRPAGVPRRTLTRPDTTQPP